STASAAPAGVLPGDSCCCASAFFLAESGEGDIELSSTGRGRRHPPGGSGLVQPDTSLASRGAVVFTCRRRARMCIPVRPGGVLMRPRFSPSWIPLAITFVLAASARAQSDDPATETTGLMLLNAKSAAAKRASTPRRAGFGVYAGTDPETVWVGHVSAGATYDYGPYHIGRGNG